MLFLILHFEISVNNILAARTSGVPGGLLARRSCLRPGLLLRLTPADFLVRGRTGFPEDLLEFFGF
jgi:hypothetical protein